MMSEQVAMTDPVDLSIGGMKGHIFAEFSIYQCFLYR